MEDGDEVCLTQVGGEVTLKIQKTRKGVYSTVLALYCPVYSVLENDALILPDRPPTSVFPPSALVCACLLVHFFSFAAAEGGSGVSSTASRSKGPCRGASIVDSCVLCLVHSRRGVGLPAQYTRVHCTYCQFCHRWACNHICCCSCLSVAW